MLASELLYIHHSGSGEQLTIDISFLVKRTVSARVDLVHVDVAGGAVDRGRYCREQ